MPGMQYPEILRWLRQTREEALLPLWAAADATRHKHVGDAVHLRGLIEVSNICIRQCLYCGVRAGTEGPTRYRMNCDEVLTCARQAREFGYGTVVLQAGEDPGLERETVAEWIRAIKRDTGLAVTLSLGERNPDDWQAWKQAGADRYLLRFETSDPTLYARIHPALPGRPSDRLADLRALREMGYEIGSGVMVGIPGQTWDILARDIETFAGLDLDMIGAGPFLPSPRTPLGGPEAARFLAPEGEQVPNDELTTLKVVALARLVCPEANIPSTTALATLDPKTGRELGLSRGANVVMPNLTPPQYRVLYEIYPGKACVNETAEVCNKCMHRRIESLGRHIGTGPGGRGQHRAS